MQHLQIPGIPAHTHHCLCVCRWWDKAGGIWDASCGMQDAHPRVCRENSSLPSGKHSRTASVLRSRRDQILPANALYYPSCLGSAAFLGVAIPTAWGCPFSPLHPHNSVSLLAKLPIKSSAQVFNYPHHKTQRFPGFSAHSNPPFPWMRVEGKQREHLPTPTRLFIHGKGRGWSTAPAQPWQLAAPWEL